MNALPKPTAIRDRSRDRFTESARAGVFQTSAESAFEKVSLVAALVGGMARFEDRHNKQTEGGKKAIAAAHRASMTLKQAMSAEIRGKKEEAWDLYHRAKRDALESLDLLDEVIKGGKR